MLSRYVGSKGRTTYCWTGNVAQIEVTALGQSAMASIEAGVSDLTISARLPLLLAPFAAEIETAILANAPGMLSAPATLDRPQRRAPPRPAKPRKSLASRIMQWF